MVVSYISFVIHSSFLINKKCQEEDQKSIYKRLRKFDISPLADVSISLNVPMSKEL